VDEVAEGEAEVAEEEAGKAVAEAPKTEAVLRAVFKRTWRKTWQRPVVLTFSFVQPLMWMLFFGYLFQRFPLGEELQGVSYRSFVLPGICAMTVLFGASQSGILMIRDLQTGFLGRMLASPARPAAILAGKTLADVSRLLLQALGVFLLGLLLGAGYAFEGVAIPTLLLGLLFLLIFGWWMALLSCWVALATRAQEKLATFIHTVNMPLLFTSTALVPQKQMPEWLRAVAEHNPLSFAVDLLRGGLLGQKVEHAGWLLLILLPLTAFLTLRALRFAVLDSEVVE